MKNYHEFCADIASEIFRLIDEKWSLLAWRKEWSSKGAQALPQGVRGYYGGLNLFKLLACQQRQGFSSAHWLTYKQVQQMGGRVCKGAKGVQICFWKLVEKTQLENSMDSDDKVMPVFRTYTVFNRDQTTLDSTAITPPDNAKGSVHALLKQHAITVEHYGSEAYYLPSDDAIVLPRPSQFSHTDAYLATLLHEVVHWSGASDRLDRMTLKQYSTDLAARAEEELVAEIGSVFLATHFGVVGELEKHASYVASWKSQLKPVAVARAISAASKAFQ